MRDERPLILITIASLALAGPASAEEGPIDEGAPQEPTEEPRRRLELELAPLYSFGERHGFGGQLNASYGFRVWRTEHGSGLIDLGLLLAYGAEPYSLSDRFLGQAHASGGTHRIEALLFVGHSIRVLSSRRLLLGLYLYGGWVQALLKGHIENELYGISRSTSASSGAFSTGLALSLGVAVTERVTLIAKARAPFPYAPAPVTAYVFVSLGVSISLL